MTKNLILRIVCTQEMHERFLAGEASLDHLKDIAGRAIDRFFTDYPTLPAEVTWAPYYAQHD